MCLRLATGSPHSHLVPRDDALELYGFATEEERELFLMLIPVQWVGPKVALAVLSAGPPRELLKAIAARRCGALPGRPGLGKGPRRGSSSSCARRSVARLPEQAISVGRGDDPPILARDGLIELGYAPIEVDELLDGAAGERAEDLIAHALKAARR